MITTRVDSTVAVSAEGLVKAFGKTRAVDRVDLTVAAGSVYGVLGPNGAGKTSAAAENEAKGATSE